MRREKKKRNKIIIGLISILLLMSVGYAAFQTNLNIKGTSKISSNWDIRITNVTEGNKTGNGENAKTPTWTNLTASMEANLYEKGDAMEYEVTVENKGTFDAKLENILTNIKSNNEAIKISFSGYTKGEKLYKNSSKIVNVRIEYNKDYTGTLPTNSSEVEITLDYGQAEGGTITPTNDYLVTYDYKTNGGVSSTSQNEYLSEGSKIDLTYTATKAGWTFAGWNTNKDATVGLTSLEMKNADVTLYAIYKKEGKTLTANFNNNGGVGTIDSLTCKIPTVYNNTVQPETCNIVLPSNTFTKEEMEFIGWNTDKTLKVGLEINQSIDKDTEYYAIWKDTTKPIIDNVSTSSTTNSITVVVAAHDDQSGIVKYEYSINDGAYVESKVKVYTFDGLVENTGYNIKLRVTNGDELVAYSDIKTTVTEQLKQNVIASGDGLYVDANENARYVYRGANPNNYIKFNDEIWRIISLESDGTIKIIKNDFLADKLPWDSKNSKNWSKPATLNTYLNSDYYDNLNDLAKSQIQNHSFNIGTVVYDSSQDFATDLIQDRATTGKGNVGLVSVIDYMKASKDINCDNLYHGVYYNETNPRPCANENYLFDSNKYWWTINGRTESDSGVWVIVPVGSFGSFGGFEDWYTAQDPLSVRPVVYLKSNIRLSGNGTLSSPYLIENGVNTQKLYKPTFSESGTNTKTVTISYPEGCGSKYSCSYSKDGGTDQDVTSSTKIVTFNNNGSLIAKVSDGDNEVTSSYTVLLSYLYDYSGKVQTFTAPLDGYYKIEAWGAQGGGEYGGKGAYTTGDIYLNKGTSLYIHVGQQPTDVTSTVYNGGGISNSTSNRTSGGGATDIRMANGLWSDSQGLLSRIMVAAGGGGSFAYSSTNYLRGGDGGTLLGNDGKIGVNCDTGCDLTIALGGRQTTGGTGGSGAHTSGDDGRFGYGANGVGQFSAGGGGGYFGGGSSGVDINRAGSGGGGSSYISGYAGVDSVDASGNFTHNTLHYSGKYFINAEMTSGINTGNGRARITYVGLETANPDSQKLTNVRYITDCMKGNSSNGYSHWIEIQAISKGVNVAKGKSVTSNFTESVDYGYSFAVDGQMDNAKGNYNFTSSPDGYNYSCLTVDLGNDYNLEELRIWHRFDGQVYYGIDTYFLGNYSTKRILRIGEDASDKVWGTRLKRVY